MSIVEKFIPPYPLKTPVLFLVFNRLDTTKQVFEAIRQAKPPKLYVASDGARKSKEGETEKVQKVRDYIMSNIDWNCEVKTLFRDENLGCKYAVSGAINWFFENEEMGIILEDDCLPSQSFFWFCEELLEIYKNDTRVWHIGGTNPIDKELTSNEYYFSKYNRIWGWASWRRAWIHYDVDIGIWPKIKREKILFDILEQKEAKIFEKIFDNVYEGKVETWDYQWFLIRLLNAKAIIPNANLISNLGFGEEATHTTDEENYLANLARGEMSFPLVKKSIMVIDHKKDSKWSKELSKDISIIRNIIRKIIK
ncbi:nucleotide-diphospho-sugar transferase [Francisella hispaniensis]|uniref:Nucleotide-diphospho-sugar transferase n=1 Tax=Francisella hispaniensis FSC454 TaxID=1088883 RepID=A0AAC9NPK8_9GAMM|nr:nucleotide-diphospho-sugar transferase [Francisella hispaniensis]APD50324.1 nucleotide-diphospho-sugar transferase [Francisella hispaniensis FSC454]KYW88460.1 nucleotide-diphospho-sugar transferase [Francisella hispaniensis FSC454]